MRLPILFVSLISLSFAIDVTLTTNLPTPINTSYKRHVHHQHNKQSEVLPSITSTITSTETTLTLAKRATTTRSSSDALPTLSVTTTSYSYSIEVPTTSNPYIFKSNLPDGLIFIIVGSIIAFVLSMFLIFRVVTYIISNLKAKTEKEVYFHNYNSTFNSLGSSINGFSSSNSSMFEKTSLASTSSLHLLSKYNSTMFQQHADDSTNISSQPGRSYRDNVAGSRGSMYISPVLEIMNYNKNSSSQLDLPLYHKNLNGSALSLTNTFLNSSSVDSYHGYKERQLSEHHDSDEDSSKRMKRPPSQFLDDLINEIDIQ